jgi:hypothetical protein
VREGEQSEFRVHSPEAYELELYRCGLEKQLIRKLGWYDEHGPRATVQITPDGDYTRTGVEWNKFGYANPALKQYVTAPAPSGLYYFQARTKSGLYFSFPWIVAPAKPRHSLAVLASNITWNAYNAFGGRSNYINADQLPPVPCVNSRQELHRYTDPEYVNYSVWDYAPLSFERPESINVIPDEGACRLPHRPCRVAAAGLARTGRFRLRLLCRDATARRHPQPRRLRHAADQHASRVLVERDVLRGEAVGARAGWQAGVPGGERVELRGAFHRSLNDGRDERRRE